MLHTTFALAHKAGACAGRYQHLAKVLGGIRAYGKDTPIPLTVVLEHNGLDDTLWALCCVLPEEAAARDKLARLFACDCAERVLPLFEKEYPEDKRPRKAIKVARLFAEGKATTQELAAARAAAWDAARAAVRDASRAAVRDAVRDVAWEAARAAVRDAVAAAAWDAVWEAARDAVRAAERTWQSQHLQDMLLA